MTHHAPTLPDESGVPDLRIEIRNDVPASPAGDYVLYWMTMYRRPGWNFSLQRAAQWARSLDRPLVILEALRCGYPWASDRLHRFLLQGMDDNDRHFADRPVLYFPYVEPEVDAGKHLLSTLAQSACVVVTDDFPCYMLPRMLAAAARQIQCRLEVVDSNGLLPMRAAQKVHLSAFDFRRFLQKALPEHLGQGPAPDPLAGLSLPTLAHLPAAITRRWPRAGAALLKGTSAALKALPIDHDVGPAGMTGGVDAATERLHTFLTRQLPTYPEDRRHPDIDGSSRFSPYLHFGHLSVHQVFVELAKEERWTPTKLSKPAHAGQRAGWWGMSEPAEAFLDELITWRELGFNMCWQRPDDYDRFESLPDWAQVTLKAHEPDRREHHYTLAQLEAGATHDPLWNAAQMQLVRDGWFHNQMRMLWGKKILQWSATPRAALHAMSELMGKYSLDGRNPNSWSGYFWVLGRYDRPWGPERPVFGKVRYMSSENTARKLHVGEYLKRYAPPG